MLAFVAAVVWASVPPKNEKTGQRRVRENREWYAFRFLKRFAQASTRSLKRQKRCVHLSVLLPWVLIPFVSGACHWAIFTHATCTSSYFYGKYKNSSTSFAFAVKETLPWDASSMLILCLCAMQLSICHAQLYISARNKSEKAHANACVCWHTSPGGSHAVFIKSCQADLDFSAFSRNHPDTSHPLLANVWTSEKNKNIFHVGPTPSPSRLRALKHDPSLAIRTFADTFSCLQLTSVEEHQVWRAALS